ncbi:hypothetical protein I6N91_00245 [Arthrobacter sp. MSA 4-2]|uniref:hypothetical protein n=1 Tax=Arthrobacter sp. MSA 4-2 TaxID=2794349 RepID=UPI0018E7284C|nr:hypothetical protein [Arthrobacter sp. MSA 4-2]MBJ2119404.1 hypothetical protein [Arthrobacter sp. MSA 4-2]
MIDWPVTLVTAAACIVLCGIMVVVAAVVARRTRISHGGDPWLLRAPLLPLVLAVIVGLIGLYALLLLVAFGAEDFSLPATANVANPVLVAATLIAGALTAAYAVLRLRAHLIAEARGKLDVTEGERAAEKHRTDQESALIERFSTAVGLLADDHAISRIAGAHLVFVLGDEWKNGTQRCFDVLVSHLRGLRGNADLDDPDVAGGRGTREEVRLITAELLRRLSTPEAEWRIRSGDFQGVVLGDADFSRVAGLGALDLSHSLILGDLRLPIGVTDTPPNLTRMKCNGELEVQWSPSWTELNVAGAIIDGSISLAGEKMAGSLNAQEVRVTGDITLGFEEFEGDLLLDGAEVQGEIQVGSKTLRSRFGTGDRQITLSLAEASFARFNLRNSAPGPLLNLSGAVGAVDLSESRFPFEVTANELDASTGLTLRRARFDDAFVLDGASLPEVIDVEGLLLSVRAQNAIESSDFALRDRFIAAPENIAVQSVNTSKFDWRPAIEGLRDHVSAEFVLHVEQRLGAVENDLPLDWANRETFTSLVMREVSRAAAQADASDSSVKLVKGTLRESLNLAGESKERS